MQEQSGGSMRSHRRDQTLRVLLAEDNAFVAELFQHTLAKAQDQAAGCKSVEFITARTGVEALRCLLENATIDMVILDHYLPGITGCSLLRRIRSMPGHENTPVLMISMGGEDVKREALEAGVSLYLDKPIISTQLLESLRALTSGAPHARSSEPIH